MVSWYLVLYTYDRVKQLLLCGQSDKLRSHTTSGFILVLSETTWEGQTEIHEKIYKDEDDDGYDGDVN